MSENKVYYKIADHIVSVEACSEMIQELDGFKPFVVNSTDSDLCIQLNGNKENVFDGHEYYTIETPLMTCLFTQCDEKYDMYLKSLHREKSLSLRYEYGDDTIEICGDLEPRLLKFALWVAFGLAVLKRQTIAIHASTIIHHGKAILFLGESGTGKSTHARLWQEYIQETTLLNDDSPIIRVEDSTCFVYGSPWSGKTPCYRQTRAELGAIIRLSQAPENRIHYLNLHEAIGALYPSFPPAFSTHEKLAEPIYGILSDILKQIPVYHLECLPDKYAAQLAYNTIFS